MMRYIYRVFYRTAVNGKNNNNLEAFSCSRVIFFLDTVMTGVKQN